MFPPFRPPQPSSGDSGGWTASEPLTDIDTNTGVLDNDDRGQVRRQAKQYQNSMTSTTLKDALAAQARIYASLPSRFNFNPAIQPQSKWPRTPVMVPPVHQGPISSPNAPFSNGVPPPTGDARHFPPNSFSPRQRPLGPRLSPPRSALATSSATRSSPSVGQVSGTDGCTQAFATGAGTSNQTASLNLPFSSVWQRPASATNNHNDVNMRSDSLVGPCSPPLYSVPRASFAVAGAPSIGASLDANRQTPFFPGPGGAGTSNQKPIPSLPFNPSWHQPMPMAGASNDDNSTLYYTPSIGPRLSYVRSEVSPSAGPSNAGNNNPTSTPEASSSQPRDRLMSSVSPSPASAASNDGGKNLRNVPQAFSSSYFRPRPTSPEPFIQGGSSPQFSESWKASWSAATQAASHGKAAEMAESSRVDGVAASGASRNDKSHISDYEAVVLLLLFAHSGGSPKCVPSSSHAFSEHTQDAGAARRDITSTTTEYSSSLLEPWKAHRNTAAAEATSYGRSVEMTDSGLSDEVAKSGGNDNACMSDDKAAKLLLFLAYSGGKDKPSPVSRAFGHHMQYVDADKPVNARIADTSPPQLLDSWQTPGNADTKTDSRGEFERMVESSHIDDVAALGGTNDYSDTSDDEVMDLAQSGEKDRLSADMSHTFGELAPDAVAGQYDRTETVDEYSCPDESCPRKFSTRSSAMAHWSIIHKPRSSDYSIRHELFLGTSDLTAGHRGLQATSSMAGLPIKSALPQDFPTVSSLSNETTAFLERTAINSRVQQDASSLGFSGMDEDDSSLNRTEDSDEEMEIGSSTSTQYHASSLESPRVAHNDLRNSAASSINPKARSRSSQAGDAKSRKTPRRSPSLRRRVLVANAMRPTQTDYQKKPPARDSMSRYSDNQEFPGRQASQDSEPVTPVIPPSRSASENTLRTTTAPHSLQYDLMTRVIDPRYAGAVRSLAERKRELPSQSHKTMTPVSEQNTGPVRPPTLTLFQSVPEEAPRTSSEPPPLVSELPTQILQPESPRQTESPSCGTMIQASEQSAVPVPQEQVLQSAPVRSPRYEREYKPPKRTPKLFTPDPNAPVLCWKDYCRLPFANLDDLRGHDASEHRLVGAAPKPSEHEPLPAGDQFYCYLSKCTGRLSRLDSALVHLHDEHREYEKQLRAGTVSRSEAFRCPYPNCTEKAEVKANIWKHVKKEHKIQE